MWRVSDLGRDAPRNGWNSRVSTSPNGEYNGENYAIHDGDDGEVEADWLVVGRRRRRWWWWRLRKKATARKLVVIQVPKLSTVVGHHFRTYERAFYVLSSRWKWFIISSVEWFTRVLRHSVVGCVGEWWSRYVSFTLFPKPLVVGHNLWRKPIPKTT